MLILFLYILVGDLIMIKQSDLQGLANDLDGELKVDNLTKVIYATDASVYKRTPLAVCIPLNKSDLKKLLAFANLHQCGLIPRAAGTSLAGQCVGDGIVVDLSKHFTKIGDFDPAQKIIEVEPGVIRDDLNRFLKPHGLFFGPNTATANRCMIGGMVGNNSSGTTSIKYGVTRDKIKAMEVILADGSRLRLEDLTKDQFQKKCALDDQEGELYRKIYDALHDQEVQDEINLQFPKESIHRRNTGYAVDELIKSEVFSKTNSANFNLSKLLAGSEGTLAFTTKITLRLDLLPPVHNLMIAAHFKTIKDCLNSVSFLMEHDLYTCEMMDKTILDCTKNSIEQTKNRYFIEGDPKAILMLELRSEDESQLKNQEFALLETLKTNTNAYANVSLYNDDIRKASELRNAGLGLLGNIVGDKKAVACIEDTAVALPDLANYISEFTDIMKSFKQDAVYYAHAGAGELHLRPILNLKQSADVVLFKKITDAVAALVKKYKGSMSGEHGDGIVRASYIPFMIGPKNYALLKSIKQIFDPNGILNPGKIIDAFPMDEKLRYEIDRDEPRINSFLDFSDSQGILRAVEKCNGSGDCRKSVLAGGTMCPSYRATKDEKDSTRGRANALREFITSSGQTNRFNHEELKEVMDLCISCKGCTSECPSNVDMATLKAEFEYQYQKTNGISWRTKLFAHNDVINQKLRPIRAISNFMVRNSITSNLIKKSIGIAEKRSLPLLSKLDLRTWVDKKLNTLQPKNVIKSVYLFIDEFTDQLDTQIGMDSIHLLTQLGYRIEIIDNVQSGRAYISKGLLEEAKVCANQNVEKYKGLLSQDRVLIGIEPSAILTFRDEYLRLADDITAAKQLAKFTFLIDEFLEKEILDGNITADQFVQTPKIIYLHGHCHQKALSDIKSTCAYLDLPENFQVINIPSGCCGMAGSFGYEKEHYEISMQIGEQTLFPAVRNMPANSEIVALGTSCRHQILDGTDKVAQHPISVLRAALKT